MVDAIVSPVLQQLTSTAVKEATEQVKLVTGVGKKVEKLKKNLRAIRAVLNDAEERQVKEESVRDWLDQLRDASYDMEDVLDEWNYARLKLQVEGVEDQALVPRKKMVYSFLTSPCNCFGLKQVVLRHDIAHRINEINKNLDDIAKTKDMFHFNVNTNSVERSDYVPSTSFVDVSEIRGRDEEKKFLKSKLLCENSEEQEAVQIISVVGMGGIGKTSLAQFVYNDNDVINNFEKRVWVCVSEPFDQFRIAKAIIEGLDGSIPNLGELQSLLQHIYASIATRKILLILDDVWIDDYNKWEPFHHCLKNGARGSKILVTARKETVASMMESTVITIRELSEEKCWLLFSRLAFFGRPNSERERLEEIGKKIVAKCKGLPLAVKSIASLLRFKRTKEEWQAILDSDMWKLEEFEKGLLGPLFLSYNELPSMLKRCFSYCAIFPKHCILEVDELITLWMAQGYLKNDENKEMEIIGQKYFDCLAARSFFQELKYHGNGEIVCKMHDIVHDFARYIRKNECVSIEVDGSEERFINIFDEKVRHLSLELGGDGSFPNCIFSAKKLRSFLIHHQFEVCSPVIQDFSDQFTRLRALKIDGGSSYIDADAIIEVLKKIDKFIHLRYLKLYLVNIKELPESCCELYNLQTLLVESCSMERLPQGIGKLVNLRNLMCSDSIQYMPSGVERLTCLRTLSKFVASRGGKYGGKACNLEALKHLKYLRGHLTIRGLGNVTEVDEAKKAELEKRSNLSSLGFVFDKEEEETREEMNGVIHDVDKIEAISEALQPPPNLERLYISCYSGKTFPNWLLSLDKLTTLRIRTCHNCEHLPPFGKLPSLWELWIDGMKSVKRLGKEFLGIERDDSSSSSVIAFPKLKKFTIENLKELEEFDFGITRSNGKEDVRIMPLLNYLSITDCPILKELPDHILQSSKLQKLFTYKSPIIEERFKKETGEDWHKISHIPIIILDHRYVQGGRVSN